MTKLKAGDVRKAGDVYVRRGRWVQATYGDNAKPEQAYPVRLIGHPILVSDLIADDFYRP